MTSCAGLPKYAVGQKVRVKHPEGEWRGVITYLAQTGTGSAGFSGWEYEVTNAPVDNALCGFTMPGGIDGLGYRWHPLLWEEQIVEVIS